MGDDGMAGVKTCPQCGQLLFADMDICYGCLHSFAREGGPVVGQAFADKADGPVAPRTPPAARHMARTAQAGFDAAEADIDMDEPPDMGKGTLPSASPSRPTPDGGPAVRASTVDVGGAMPPDVRARAADEEVTSVSSVPVVVAPPRSRPASPPLALRVQTSSMEVAVPLPASGLSVGRSPDNDVVLHSHRVSRRHLRIEPTADGATMFDLGATNPVLFRGRAAPAELTLSAGDVVDVCGTLMTLVRARGVA